MTIRRLRVAYWISMATYTHSQYAILTSFHHNGGCTKAPRCYAARTLPVLSVKQCSLRLLKFVSIITTIRHSYFFYLDLSIPVKHIILFTCN